MIFETHAHYDDERFTEDQESVLADLPRKGISPVINVGASIASTRTTLELAQKYDFIYAAVGVHPSDIDGLNEETFAWLTQQTTYEKTVAVGEIGLDYYWDKEADVQERQPDGTCASGRSAGHHPFAGCGRRYNGNCAKRTRSRNYRAGRNPLLFLLTGDGTGIYQAWILHRCRWCGNVQKCEETGAYSGRDSA